MMKAIFFDIDGTLVPHGKSQIVPSTIKALQQLKEQGIKIFIATGRAVPSIDFVLNQFEFDGYLALNGQYCYADHQTIRKETIDKESLKKVLPYLEDKKISSMFAEKDYVYVNMISDNLIHFRKGHLEGLEPIDDPKRSLENDTYQLMTFIPEEKEKEFFEHLPNCKSARWHPEFADIIPCHGGKNTGIDAMCQYLDISIEEVMAFGDGGNDIDMLKHVGLGIAMGNANDIVKKAANYVTDDVEDDGIYHALQYFGLV